MSNKQFCLALCVLATIIVIYCAGLYVRTLRYQQEVKINSQTAIECTNVQESARLERTRERMNWIPW